MRKMMDQQYRQAPVGGSRAGSSNNSVSQQLLRAHAQPHSSGEYLSRKMYGDPYHAVGSSSLASANAQYPSFAAPRSDSYHTESRDHLRAQMRAQRRALLPSVPLLDYPPLPYATDHAIPPRVALSSDLGGPYPGHYPASQRASQDLSDATRGTARRPEIGSSYTQGGGYGNGVVAVQRPPPSLYAYDEQGMFPGGQGILGPGGGVGGGGVVRRGSRDLDPYLLSVQPEKLIRYAASCLAPEPPQRRSRYPGTNNTTMQNYLEDDMYSNYRRAKARRTEPHEFLGSSPSGPPKRGRESEAYHNRERRRGELSRDYRGKRSFPPNLTNRRSSTGPLSKGGHDSSQFEEGRVVEHRNGGQNKRSRSSESSKPEVGEAKQKDDEGLELDKEDSELGSLRAGLSDSEDEGVVKKSEEATAATVIDRPPLAGMIFGCSSATFLECMKLQLFGLPAKNKDDVMRVTPGIKVFLFNFDTKELSGIFESTSHGGWQIQPDAFREFGGFPAQVQVCCSEQCPNLSHSVFRPAIKENYIQQNRFRFDLNTKQVKDLVRLFRQAARDRSHQQQDILADRYLTARQLQSEDYSAGGGRQQQRPYSRQHQARFGQSTVSYARVVSIMSTPQINFHESKGASKKRALKRRKNRKVASRRESPPKMADNCSFDSLSGETQEADVTINTNSKCCRCDDDTTSNTNHDVIVREGIETGIEIQHRKEMIVETVGYTAAAKATTDPSGPDHHCLSPSKKAEEFPLLQSDHLDNQVSFLVEDSYNYGNFRLAGRRAEEERQGGGALAVPQGPLRICANVIQLPDSTLASTVEEGLQTVSRAADDGADPSLVVTPDEVQQQLALVIDGSIDQIIPGLDEHGLLGDTGVVPERFNTEKGDLKTCESITTHFITTDGNLPDDQMDEVLVETAKDDADRELLPHVGNNAESVVSGEVGGVVFEDLSEGKKSGFAVDAALLNELRMSVDRDDVVKDDSENDVDGELVASTGGEDVVRFHHDDKVEEIILAVGAVEKESVRSVDGEDVVRFYHDEDVEVIPVSDAVGSLLLPIGNVMDEEEEDDDDDDEAKEKVIIVADDAVDCKAFRSGDEGVDEIVRSLDSDYEEEDDGEDAEKVIAADDTVVDYKLDTSGHEGADDVVKCLDYDNDYKDDGEDIKKVILADAS